MLIQYDLNYIRQISSNLSDMSNQIVMNRESIETELGENSSGKFKEKVNEIIVKSNECVDSYKKLVLNSTLFITNMADYIESIDTGIGRKIGEK